MGRGKKTPNIVNIEELEIENEIEIDYKKLAESICEAIQLSKKADDELTQKARKEILKQRTEYLGEKDFSHIKNWLWRNIRTMLNKGLVFLKILFVPRHIAKSISAVDSLFKLITALFFGIARMVLYVAVFWLLIQVFVQQSLLMLPYAFVTFVFAQLIRIAQIEVEYMEDRGYLMAISGTLIAIASLIIAILSELEVI